MKSILGNKATVATPDSFLKLLGSLFALSDKFTLAASLIAIIVAVLIAFKTMAGNIAERAREIGVLKAVGWTNRNVVSQLMSESVIQCFMAGILGLLIALVACVRFKFHEGQYPYPLGDESDSAFSSRRGRPDFQDPAASCSYPLEPGFLCHSPFSHHRRNDRRVAGQAHFKNQTFGGLKT